MSKGKDGMAKISIKKDDKVVVLAGKGKGQKSKVKVVLPGLSRVIVEKVNLVKRHARATQKNPKGGIVDKEAPIDVSNVQLLCPSCGKRTRIAKRRTEDKKVVRVCKKCAADIDKL